MCEVPFFYQLLTEITTKQIFHYISERSASLNLNFALKFVAKHDHTVTAIAAANHN